METISKFPRSCYFSGYFLTKKIDEIHWLTDDLIRFRYISESIGSKDKRNASLAAGKEISHGVTDINRGFHIISSGDEGDVGTLIEIVITIAQMTFEIFAEFETKDALANGADEIDMVINIGWAKDGKFDAIEEEIRTLKKVCGSKILKVIIETCLLTDEEKIKMCEAVTKAGADYIKTSTGFSKAGATFDDIKLFSEHIGPNVKMKAAGGISSLDDAEKFLSLGADRLGTSRIVKIIKNEEATGY